MLIDDHKKVQSIAKEVHKRLGPTINKTSAEQTILDHAQTLLRDFGVPDTWYHDVPAFVLLGSRSCLSISGKDYVPSTELVGKTNLVTVDLSPCVGNIWGDCARSFVVENGRYTPSPVQVPFKEGLHIEEQLHTEMTRYVTPETRFSDLYEYANDLISDYGYENLDFLNNLGHSIETDTSKRKFIDKDCHEQLGNVQLFTFEPHVRKQNDKWGFKYEEIYYFDKTSSVNRL